MKKEDFMINVPFNHVYDHHEWCISVSVLNLYQVWPLKNVKSANNLEKKKRGLFLICCHGICHGRSHLGDIEINVLEESKGRSCLVFTFCCHTWTGQVSAFHGNPYWLYWYEDVVCLQLRPWRARLGCLWLKLAPELCNSKRAALLLLCWRSEVMRLRMRVCLCVFVCMPVESFLSRLLFKAFHAALDQSQSQGIIQHKHWVQKHHSLSSHTCWIQFFRHFLTSTKFLESQQGGGLTSLQLLIDFNFC